MTDLTHRRVPGARPALRSLVAVAAVVALTGPAFAASAPSRGASAPTSARPRVLARFDPTAKQTPENLAVAADGTIDVSLSFAGELQQIPPAGLPRTVTVPTGGGITVGIVLDRAGHEAYFGVRSSHPDVAGIWRISQRRFIHPERVAALPIDAFPNGMAFDSRGSLYVADSALGRIWRIAPNRHRATVWTTSQDLTPTGASFSGFPLPGANGLKIFHGQLYVSNTSRSTVLRIPIRRDGTAGRTQDVLTGIEADDFAFATDGALYLAENPASSLVRARPRTGVMTLAGSAEGLANTSAVAFDPRPGHRHTLYLTNSAYFGGTPSLMSLTVPDVGAH